MPRIDSARTMLVEELRDLLGAEQRLIRAVPKLVDKATNEELADALAHQLSETHQHVVRLESAFEVLDVAARGTPCAGIKGILKEADTHIDDAFENDVLRDVTIIGAAQKAKHYEIAAYGDAIFHARIMGLDAVVAILEGTLAEEKAADATLTRIAETVVSPEAVSASRATAHCNT
jgi:ferritin-like metal-binding protein YciE